MALDRTQFLTSVLDAIEERESKLLVWGIVDGAFNEEELLAIINERIDAALKENFTEFLEAADVLRALQDRGLITPVDNGTAPMGFRSRMAETVRLMLRLRQLFPKHARKANGWLDAPNLVADFRFQRRQRQYPRRDVPPSSALDRLRAAFDEPALVETLRVLLKLDDPRFKLAEFQVRAAERILGALKTDEALATIICAGTGSGKTLAFYLPAIASVSRHAGNRNASRWVKTVSLYPRIELLKDQFREVLDHALRLRGADIGLRVGAFFGDTPHSAEFCNWRTAGRDRICPILQCLKCKGDLLWKEADYSRGKERLQCRSCSFELDESVLVLTRRSMASSPPDILFTTTEMLNQRLGDNRYRHLFGVGPKAARPPELVLLDEAHTYDGRHGAQVAYLMRRWRRLADRNLRFVGLSATLSSPEPFFSALTGVPLSLVQEVSARLSEIQNEGAEYFVALRGDPVSRTALLSTTIQAAMLMERCLDPKATPLSAGLYGARTFVFTDDLDATNRLYFDLLNAEGRTGAGLPDFARAPNGGLAALRANGNSLAQYRAGQDWRACEQLGHNLSDRLNVERVSSQDRGFDPDADIVVATAALEVGFDDPLAGAVIQHKAPRGSAGFLQRRGRAGRVRGMRPWTVVVLSDYGRDRVAYQAYDQLFDPRLAPRSLPLSNRTIQRMQSVYTLMDYLGQRLENSADGNVWKDLAGPGAIPSRKQKLIKELWTLLESEQAAERLNVYLKRTLRLEKGEVSALAWEFPRPLMTVVIPTALRRLQTDWRVHGRPGSDFQLRNNPLPEFIPSTLFSELNLAEVAIEFPASNAGIAAPEAVMPVLSALREFAPGRVSRRFGIYYKSERYWLSPTDIAAPAPESTLDIDTVGEHVLLGDFSAWNDGIATPVRVFSPRRLRPAFPAKAVADSSNARPMWHTQLVPQGEPLWLATPAGSEAQSAIARIGVFTHARHAPVEVRRFTTGSSAEIGLGGNNRVRVKCRFEKDGQAAGLGVRFPADAILIELRIPAELASTSLTPDSKGRALRTSRFVDRAWRGEVLQGVPNPFMREWLAQILLSALAYEAVQQHSDLSTACESLRRGTASIRLQDVLATLFQSQVIQADGQDFALEGDDKLRQELLALLGDPGIVEELYASATVLWADPGPDWESWLSSTYHSTVAAAILRAISDLCPTLDPDDVLLDLDRGPDAAGGVEVWISERAPGGNGQVEEFLRAYADDPRRFFSLIRSALEISEFELIDQQLTRLTDTLTDDDSESPVKERIERFRGSASNEEMTLISRELRLALIRSGYPVFHGFLTALGTRILRAGTGASTDAFVSSCLRSWSEQEARLGIEIDLRIMAYCLSQSTEIDDVARAAGLPTTQDLSPWRMNAIYGLLWPRGRQIRNSALQIRSPFANLPPIERLVVIDSLRHDETRVSVESNAWFEEAATQLSAGRLVTLMCTPAAGDRLAAAISFLITNPIDSGYLRTYARLQRVRRTASELLADIELAEAVQ